MTGVSGDKIGILSDMFSSDIEVFSDVTDSSGDSIPFELTISGNDSRASIDSSDLEIVFLVGVFSDVTDSS